MTLKERITEDMKVAMKARQPERLLTIRSLLAAIKQKEVDERIAVDDTQVLAIVDKLVKQRKDSIGQFEQAGRTDLVDKEKFELDVLVGYLPQQASAAEVSEAIESVIAAVNATGPQDMGKVMAQLKPKLAGKTDLSAVSGLVKARLARG